MTNLIQAGITGPSCHEHMYTTTGTLKLNFLDLQELMLKNELHWEFESKMSRIIHKCSTVSWTTHSQFYYFSFNSIT